MAFELALSEPLPAVLRRVAADRLTEALAATDPGLSDAAVHSARKRLKELRALLRLLRGPLPRATRRRQNATYRDAARPLSSLRDSAVLLEALDDLLAARPDDLPPKSLAPLRAALTRDRRAALRAARESDALPRLRSTLTASLRDPARWPLPNDDDFATLSPGLLRTYRQGRRAMKAALADPTDDHLHEWRKRAKDLRYHLELLIPLNAPKIKPLATLAKDLTDLLGTDHDLAVLQSLLITTHATTLPQPTHSALQSLLAKRRRSLQRQTRNLARRLYAHKPKPFVGRLESWWAASH
jgi:CHAD domain-containing protein